MRELLLEILQEEPTSKSSFGYFKSWSDYNMLLNNGFNKYTHIIAKKNDDIVLKTYNYKFSLLYIKRRYNEENTKRILSCCKSSVFPGHMSELGNNPSNKRSGFLIEYWEKYGEDIPYLEMDLTFRDSPSLLSSQSMDNNQWIYAYMAKVFRYLIHEIYLGNITSYGLSNYKDEKQNAIRKYYDDFLRKHFTFVQDYLKSKLPEEEKKIDFPIAFNLKEHEQYLNIRK